MNENMLEIKWGTAVMMFAATLESTMKSLSDDKELLELLKDDSANVEAIAKAIATYAIDELKKQFNIE